LIGVSIFERLHAIVDVDRDGSCHAGNAAADHQDHAELAESVRKAENARGDDPANRERQQNLAEGAPPAGTQYSRGIEQPFINALKRAEQRLHGERQDTTDATTSPVKVNASVCPNSLIQIFPNGPCEPMAISK